MFCNVDYSTNHTLQGMYCYAIPNLAGGKIMTVITVSESEASKFGYIHAEYINSNTRIKVTIKVNELVTNIGIYFCHTSNPTKGQALFSGEYSTKINSIAAGETKSVTFTNPLSGKSYLVYVMSDGVWVAKGLLPMISIMLD